MRREKTSLDRRRHKRTHAGKIIEYRAESSAENEMRDGILFDMSEDGLSILAVHPLRKGQRIFMKSTMALPSSTATVQWCENYYDLYFKIGLKYL